MLNLTRLVLFTCLCIQMIQAQSPSISHGRGLVLFVDLMPDCPSNHITPLGSIMSSDGKNWLVPTDSTFLNASYLTDLYNECNGITPASMINVDTSNIPVIVIDEEGEIITGYLFADNYFELYINDSLVGVDPVPFTPFNSCVVKFKVKRPYTIAVKLVDWEENIGLGSEIQNLNTKYHPGDGGFIAQFSDGTVTDETWKTQSFYIAPLQSIADVVESSSGVHDSSKASTKPNCDEDCFALHYEIPDHWTQPGFDDHTWPKAFVYEASQVTNQAAYTNFANQVWNRANFIWSSNLILDNVVLTRKTINGITANDLVFYDNNITVNNPVHNELIITSSRDINDAEVSLINISGHTVSAWSNISLKAYDPLNLTLFDYDIIPGIYFIQVKGNTVSTALKLIKI